MGFWTRVLGFVVMATSAIGALCHGQLSEPKARNVVHNSNYCPHCLAAGGPGVTYAGGRVWPNSLHGVCGDPHNAARDHEAGGKFATRVITGKYSQGQTVTLRIKITAPHGGRFSFGVCPLPDKVTDADERKIATQACFDAHKLINVQDGTPYWWFGKKPLGEYPMDFRLPAGVTCKRCVLQWHYESGNSCTIPGTPEQHIMSPNMVPCDQTGVMEEFWNCADVSILPGPPRPPPRPNTRARQVERFAGYAPYPAEEPRALTVIAIAMVGLVALVGITALVPAAMAAGVGTGVLVYWLSARVFSKPGQGTRRALPKALEAPQARVTLPRVMRACHDRVKLFSGKLQ